MSEQLSFLFHNHRKRSSGKWSFLFHKPANWFLLLDYLRVEVMLVFSLYKCYSRLSTVFCVSITFLQRRRLPFAPKCLFKKVCIANSLWRQSVSYQNKGQTCLLSSIKDLSSLSSKIFFWNATHTCAASIWAHLHCLPGIWKQGRTDLCYPCCLLCCE